jgi:hypothetical protein
MSSFIVHLFHTLALRHTIHAQNFFRQTDALELQTPLEVAR